MKHYKTILVGLDGSTNSLSALEKAGELAQLMDAKLVLVTVVKPELQVGFGGPGLEVNTLSAKQLEVKQVQAQKMLTEYQAKLPEQVKQQAVVVLGDPKVMLSETLPQKYQAELVIVGATGLNKLDRFILGSTAAYVVRNTKADTLVVNE